MAYASAHAAEHPAHATEDDGGDMTRLRVTLPPVVSAPRSVDGVAPRSVPPGGAS